jgi:hypothetical protein
MGIVQQLRNEIKVHQIRIDEIQKACPHPSTVVERVATHAPFRDMSVMDTVKVLSTKMKPRSNVNAASVKACGSN